MRQYTINTIEYSDFPDNLKRLDKPPKSLRIIGKLPENNTKYLTIVGSRKHSEYGRCVTEMLVDGLKGYPITIVSGMAFGIDSFAHTHAMNAKLHTIAIPGSGLHEQVLYPRNNFKLAEKIIENGGALLSHFDDMQESAHWTFPARNHIMAGIADAVLIIEAVEKSGSLITANSALNCNRIVMAVPGPITSKQSTGTNNLIRDGAIPITCSEDILRELGFTIAHETINVYSTCSEDERKVLDALSAPLQRGELLRSLNLHNAQVLLSEMELKGLIVERVGYVYRK